MEAGRPPRKQPCFFSNKEPPEGGLAEGNMKVTVGGEKAWMTARLLTSVAGIRRY